MIVLHWLWQVVLDWHLPVMFAFGWVLGDLWHGWSERRRRRWAHERAALRSLRHMHPGPRSIP